MTAPATRASHGGWRSGAGTRRHAGLPCSLARRAGLPPYPAAAPAVAERGIAAVSCHPRRSRGAVETGHSPAAAASAGTRCAPSIPAARGHDGDILETVASVPGVTRATRTSRLRRYGDDVRGCLWRHASDLRVRLQSYAREAPVRLRRYRGDSRGCLRRLSGDTAATRGFISGDTPKTHGRVSGVATDTHRGHPVETQRCIARRHGAHR